MPCVSTAALVLFDRELQKLRKCHPDRTTLLYNIHCHNDAYTFVVRVE